MPAPMPTAPGSMPRMPPMPTAPGATAALTGLTGLTGLTSAVAYLLSRLGGYLTEPTFTPVVMVTVVTAFAVLLASRWASRPSRTAADLSCGRLPGGAWPTVAADGGPPRQRDPDAAGRVRPRAPGRATVG